MKRQYIIAASILMLASAGAATFVFSSATRDGRTITRYGLVSPAKSSYTLARYDGHFGHGTNGSGVANFNASTSTGIGVVGGLVVLANSPLWAIVSGRSGTNGQLVLVQEAGSTLSATSLYSEVGADFSGIAYSDKADTLFIHDACQQRILSAPYVPGQTSIASGQWTLVADVNTVPELGASGVSQFSELSLEDDDTPTLLLKAWFPYARRSIPIIRLEVGPAGPTATIQAVTPVSIAPTIKSHLEPGGTSVLLYGQTIGSTVELIRPDIHPHPVVGSATVGVDHLATLTTTPLVAGGVYAARVLGSSQTSGLDSPWFRFGAPDVTPIGAIRGLHEDFSPLAAFVGHDHFTVPITIDLDSTITSTAASYPAVLTVGMLGASQVVPWPTTANPDRVALIGFASLDTQVLASDPDFPPLGDVKIPISESATALEGSVLLFQWLVVFGPAPGDVYASDVVGYVVRGSPHIPEEAKWMFEPFGQPIQSAQSSASRSTPSSTATALQLEPSEVAIQTLSNCLTNCGFRPR